MYKSIQADKDTYITNKIVRGLPKTGSNVGSAGSLDLFKLYGATYSGSTPNTELSRLLVHFDLEVLRELVSQGKIDFSDPSFWCRLTLKDVYGGQPTPTNFTVSVFPLSGSFEEGLGRDVVYYSDSDACNWVSSSSGVSWFITGCFKPCNAQLGGGDYITSSTSIANTEATQYFKTGLEDLSVDVTTLVSATLAGELPDSGFRISFTNSIEGNSKTYFVKRFGTHTTYDESKRPALKFGFDDSMTDDTQNLTFDVSCNLFLRNYSGGGLSNILSGSSLTGISGSNCIILKMSTPISGGSYNLFFTGSQFSYGSTGKAFVSGTYYASVSLPSSDPILSQHLLVSSSLKFTPIWTSLDGTVVYVSGSTVQAYPPRRTGSFVPKNYVVNVLGLRDSYKTTEEGLVRVNIFDQSSPLIKVVRVPVELPGAVVKNVFYQIRNSVTDEVIVPYDAQGNATKVSSDSEGMFFKLDPGSLTQGRTYVVDIVIDSNGTKTTYRDASPVFRVVS